MKKIFLTLCAVLTVVSVSATSEVNLHNHKEKERAVRNYTIVQQPAKTIMGIECRTSNDPNGGPYDIPRHWGKFYSEDILNKIPNKVSDNVMALYCDYEGDWTKPYNFVIGCEVTSKDMIPEGMVAKELPASTYAVYRIEGEYPKNLIETWNQIWHSDLKRLYTGDFEVYGERFYQPDSKEMNVFIAIEEQNN